MIGKPLSNFSFRDTLDYVSTRQGAEVIGGNMEGRNPRELAREFGMFRRLRPTLGQAVWHLPLRLAPGEALTPAQWKRVANRVLAGMGFNDCPYTLALHPQADDGQHAHLVVSRINCYGEVVSNSFDLERLTRIERRIERDYGLREVPLVRNAVRRQGRGDRKFEEATGRPAERRILQEAVGRAARRRRPVGEMAEELRQAGVRVRVRVTANREVTGITYSTGRYEFSGSGLGTDFTWPGLLRRRGLSYVPERDLPVLLAGQEAPAAPEATAGGGRDEALGPGDGSAGAGAATGLLEEAGPEARAAAAPAAPAAPAGGEPGEAGGSGGGPGGLGGSGDPGGPPGSGGSGGGGGAGPRSPADRTSREAAAQLAAIGCPRYDILVMDPSGGRVARREACSPAQVAAMIGWLKHQNALSHEILVRPSAPAGLTLFVGVTAQNLAAAVRQGCQPAAVVQMADGSREVWLRGGRELPLLVQEAVDRELAAVFRPAHVVDQHGFGHLAGFTSPILQREMGSKRPPFASLGESPGRPYGAFQTLARRVRADLTRRATERRIAEEMAALERGASAPLPAATLAAAGAEPREAREPRRPAGAAPADPGVPAAADLPPSESASAPASADLPPSASAGAPAAESLAARSSAPPARQLPARDVAALRDLMAAADAAAQELDAAGPVRPPSSEALGQLLGALAAEEAEAGRHLAAARREIAAQHWEEAAAARQEAVEATRRLEERRQEVAETLGIAEVPAELPPAVAARLAHWQSAIARAEARREALAARPEASADDRLESLVAVRMLREELADCLRENGLRGALPRPEAAVAPGEGAAVVGAAVAGTSVAGSAVAGAAAEAAPAAPDGANVLPFARPADAPAPRSAPPETPRAAVAGASQTARTEAVAAHLEPLVAMDDHLLGVHASATNVLETAERTAFDRRVGPAAVAAAREGAARPTDADGKPFQTGRALPGGVAARDHLAAAWSRQLDAALALDRRTAEAGRERRRAGREFERLALEMAAVEARLRSAASASAAASAAHAAWDRHLVRLGEAEERLGHAAERERGLARHAVRRDLKAVEAQLRVLPTKDLFDRHHELVRRDMHLEGTLLPSMQMPAADAAGVKERYGGPELGAPEPTPGTPAPWLAERVHETDLQHRAAQRAHAEAAVLEAPGAPTVRELEWVSRQAWATERLLACSHAAAALRQADERLKAAAGALREALGEPAAAAGAGLSAALRQWHEAVRGQREAAQGWSDLIGDGRRMGRSHEARFNDAAHQVACGDVTRGTVTWLQRSAALLGRPLEGPAPAPATRVEQPTLPAAIDRWLAQRVALVEVAQVFGRKSLNGLLGPEEAARSTMVLGRLAADFQAAVVEVGRHVALAEARWPGAGAGPPPVPPRVYLDHPAFAGEPQRALALWAAHEAHREPGGLGAGRGSGDGAAGRMGQGGRTGQAGERLAERLAGALRSQVAAPRLAGRSYATFLTLTATRVAVSLWQHYANEP